MRGNIIDRLVRELECHLQEGLSLAEKVGEDGRPPLTPAQRWRFTAQALLRRTLAENHPALLAFDHHCYRGLLQTRRFKKAVELFAAGVAAAKQDGIPARLDAVRGLLEGSTHPSAPADGIRSRLSQATALLSTLLVADAGTQDASPAVSCRRLVEQGIIDTRIAGQILSEDSLQRLAGARELLDALV